VVTGPSCRDAFQATQRIRDTVPVYQSNFMSDLGVIGTIILRSYLNDLVGLRHKYQIQDGLPTG
jgi:hypothetical protein